MSFYYFTVELFYCSSAVELFYCSFTVELFYCLSTVELFHYLSTVELFYCSSTVELFYCLSTVESFYCLSTVESFYLFRAPKGQPESKCPELLANYCDMLLRKTPLSKKLTSDEIEARLRDLVRFLNNTFRNELGRCW